MGEWPDTIHKSQVPMLALFIINIKLLAELYSHCIKVGYLVYY